MKYKKIAFGFILFCCALVILWRVRYIPQPSSQSVKPVAENVSQRVPAVHVVLDFGESIATYDGVLAANAFDALSVVATSRDIAIQKKQYDFGVFVESIGNFSGSKDKAWIYHVNGVSGDVAADKKILKEGDVVLWRYMKPSY